MTRFSTDEPLGHFPANIATFEMIEKLWNIG
jgi:hypothetical protein